MTGFGPGAGAALCGRSFFLLNARASTQGRPYKAEEKKNPLPRRGKFEMGEPEGMQGWFGQPGRRFWL